MVNAVKETVVTAAIQITSEYRQALLDEGVDNVRRHLVGWLEERDQVFYGRPTCSLLEPVFVDSDLAASVHRIAERLAEAIGLVEEAARTDDRVLAHMLGHGRLYELARSRLRTVPDFVGRLDGFLGGDGVIRFVEYNPGSCGGMFFADACLALFDELLPVGATKRKWRFTGTRLADRYRAALATVASAAGLAEPFELGVVLPHRQGAEALAASPELRGLRDALAAGGGTIRFVRPSNLAFDGRRLVAGNQALEAALVLDWTDLVENLPQDHPVWAASEGCETFVANPLSAFLVRGAKSVFAILSDPAFRHLFDERMAAFLDRHVPWTRSLVAEELRDEAARRRMRDRILEGRNDLVLKPIFSIGGRRVVLGWNVSDATWAAAVEEALEGEFVVQRRVDMAQRSFYVVDGQSVETAERYMDVCPFLWADGSSEGLFVRTSGSSLLNMSAGTGSSAAVYVVEGRMAA